MPVEYAILAWGCVLALVHVFAASSVRTAHYGVGWNAGNRDADPARPTPLAGRLTRAQCNFFETFPLVIAAVSLLGLTGTHTRWTAIGAIVWLVARAAYLPIYAVGIVYVRSAVFLASLAGILMMLWPLLAATL